MDFQTAPEILEALEERIQHGILGYSESDKEYADAVVKWYQEHFQWKIERNWIVKTPGVVFALAAAVRAFTNEGDHYEIDFEDFERKIVSNRVKFFLFCSPQNPTGRVWREWELDEIHSDFINFGYMHLISNRKLRRKFRNERNIFKRLCRSKSS